MIQANIKKKSLIDHIQVVQYRHQHGCPWMTSVRVSRVNMQGNTFIGSGSSGIVKMLRLNCFKFTISITITTAVLIFRHGSTQTMITQKLLKISLQEKAGTWRTPFYIINQFQNWPPSPWGATKKFGKKCAHHCIMMRWISRTWSSFVFLLRD